MPLRLTLCALLLATLPACADETGASTALASETGGDGAPCPGMRPPPPEAIDACAGAALCDTCSFTHDGHTLNGKCVAPPDSDAPLACLPPPPPPPPEAIAACDGAAAGDPCSFPTPDGHELEGSCRTGPDAPADAPLACAPADLPPPPPPICD